MEGCASAHRVGRLVHALERGLFDFMGNLRFNEHSGMFRVYAMEFKHQMFRPKASPIPPTLWAGTGMEVQSKKE
jgi:hypothetical protein